MKSILGIVFLSIAFCFGAKAQDSTSTNGACVLLKNGVYAAKMSDDNRIYIRFCEGDSVVTTSSDAEPAKAKTYVALKHKNLMLAGKYKERNCMVFLKAKGMYGKVKMEGVVGDKSLMLTVVNKKDNTSMEYVFKYYPDSP